MVQDNRIRFFPEFLDLNEPETGWKSTGIEDDGGPAFFDTIGEAMPFVLAMARMLRELQAAKPSMAMLVRLVQRGGGKPEEALFGCAVCSDAQDRHKDYAQAILTDHQREIGVTPDYSGTVDFLKRGRPTGPGEVQA